MIRIIRNAIKCNVCGDVIESRNRHEYNICSCGRVAVDGGLDYLRRSYTESRDDYTDLSEFADDGRGNDLPGPLPGLDGIF